MNVIARQRKLKLLYKEIDIFWVFCNDIFADITKEENLSLSNESQYLLISRPSVQELLSKIKERQSNENEAGEQIGITVNLKLRVKEYFVENCKDVKLLFFFYIRFRKSGSSLPS